MRCKSLLALSINKNPVIKVTIWEGKSMGEDIEDLKLKGDMGDIEKELKDLIDSEYEKYRVHVVIKKDDYDLTKYPNQTEERKKWVNYILDEYLKKSKPYYKKGKIIHFAYIKFGYKEDDEKKIYGIQAGKTSFHKKYYSDIWFFPINEKSNFKPGKQKVKKFMNNNLLEWYTDNIVIIENENPINEEQAKDQIKKIEKKIQNKFNLKD